MNVLGGARPPLAVEGHLGDEGVGLEHHPQPLVVHGQENRLERMVAIKTANGWTDLSALTLIDQFKLERIAL